MVSSSGKSGRPAHPITFPAPPQKAKVELSAYHDPFGAYKEQLRIAENVLAFLGSIGLALSAHHGLLKVSGDSVLSADSLRSYWGWGISPGDWERLAKHTAQLLRAGNASTVGDSFASIWYKGRGKAESAFAGIIHKLVERKNDYKHDRGPTALSEYVSATAEMAEYLRECFAALGFFIQHPSRLVQQVDIDWRAKTALLDTLVYMGDHPGLRQERVSMPEALPKGQLFLEMEEDLWASTYPLISVHDCPQCKARETYMIDRIDRKNGELQQIVLKSFERGHALRDGDAARRVGEDMEYWFQTQYST